MLCKHFNKDAPTLVCAAFPAGIPEDILDNTFDHHNPHEGDQGIQFVPTPTDPTSPEVSNTDKIGRNAGTGKVTRVGVLKSFPGHKGRKGQQGGSLPRGPLPADPTSHEYSGLKLFEQLNLDNPYHIPVYVRASQLPPVKEGYERIYHGTQNYLAQNIMRYGLMPGKYSGFGERLPAFMATTKGISTFGDVNFVVDLPKADVHHVNEDWVEVGKIIEPKDITAIIPAGMSTQDIVGLLKIYDDYKAIYGDKFEIITKPKKVIKSSKKLTGTLKPMPKP
jgi:hypothetical protein